MTNFLSEGQTPEAWSETLKGHGVHVSPRLIRLRARELGEFHQIGRLMLLTSEQMEKLFQSAGSAGGGTKDRV